MDPTQNAMKNPALIMLFLVFPLTLLASRAAHEQRGAEVHSASHVEATMPQQGQSWVGSGRTRNNIEPMRGNVMRQIAVEILVPGKKWGTKAETQTVMKLRAPAGRLTSIVRNLEKPKPSMAIQEN
jgi:hypothetical protein